MKFKNFAKKLFTMGYTQDMFYGIKNFAEIDVWVKKLKLIDYTQFFKEKKETFESWKESENIDVDISCEEFFEKEISDDEFCDYLFGEGYFEKEIKDILKKCLEEEKISTPFWEYDSSEISVGVVVNDYDTFKEKEKVDKFCEKYNLGKATYFIGYDLTWCN